MRTEDHVEDHTPGRGPTKTDMKHVPVRATMQMKNNNLVYHEIILMSYRESKRVLTSPNESYRVSTRCENLINVFLADS